MREVLAVATLLLAIAVAAYGWYVLHGGFYGDDWGNADAYRFAHPPRYWTAVRSEAALLGGRPVLAVLLFVPHAVFGVHPAAQLALGVAIAVATSLCFFVLLRLLRLGTLDAAAIAALALLFPWADSAELWPTASINTAAVFFFFLGLIVAILGLRHGGRGGAAIHAGAAVLYLLSVLTYEVAGAAAALAGLVYLRRAPLRRALPRWAVDVVTVISGLTYSLLRTSAVRYVATVHNRVTDVGAMTRQSLRLLASALVPADTIPHIRMAIVGAAALLLASIIVRVIRKRATAHSRLWLRVAIVSGIAIGTAYFMFLGSGLHPLDPATGTRVNVFARFAYSSLVYALVAGLAGMMTEGQGRRGVGARALTLAAVVAIAFGYGIRLHADESAWVRASRLQKELLAATDGRFPHLDRGTTLATFDFPAEVSPGAPIFVATWDLTGALQIERRDPTLHAYPVYQRVQLRCDARQLVIRLPGSRGSAAADYGKLYFLDVPTRRAARISDAGSCRRDASRFRPGAWFAS
jgi:hypothetical protein